MKNEFSQPEAECNASKNIEPICPALQLLNFDPTSPTGKVIRPPNWFERKIVNLEGLTVGYFEGAVCADFDELTAAIGNIKPEYLSRIAGGVQFPCSALIRIHVDEEHEDKPDKNGSSGLKEFDEISESNNCYMSFTRRGHIPNLPGSMEKNLHFYTKSGWKRLDDVNTEHLKTPWMYKMYVA